MDNGIYKLFFEAFLTKKKLLAILIDPEKFALENTASFLRKLPVETSHIFVGGSTVPEGVTELLVQELKFYTAKPIVLFPGDVTQISNKADALLFLNLISGRNPEFLIGQHIKAVPFLKNTSLEIIPTAYILIDGGSNATVSKVTSTTPMPQTDVQAIINTAKAGELLGLKLIYLEAGSGAKIPVSKAIISEIKKEVSLPLIVGGGIKTIAQRQEIYQAGADVIVMGTAFEKPTQNSQKEKN